MARELPLRRTPLALRSIGGKVFHDQRRSLPWWLGGIAALVLSYASFWPSVRESGERFNEFVERAPGWIRDLIGSPDFATPEGYIRSELFALTLPILLLVYGIGLGARAIAGEEERGSLDLLLSTPVRRRRVVVERFAALAGGLLLLSATAWAAILVLGPPFDLRLDPGGVAATCLLASLLGLALGSVALAVGAASGRRTLAAGVAAAAALLSFLVHTFGSSVGWLRPLRWASPFHSYAAHDPLLEAFHPLDAAVLAGIALVALAVAVVAFDRRDVGVG
ncbi:MAG TPA: ABC transporter permease subunit [Actinomycetota bacterium]|nr:ABC transporter permease subunit [Actinomycetota bacterium]